MGLNLVSIGHCVNEENIISCLEYMVLEMTDCKSCIHLMKYVLPRLHFLLQIGGGTSVSY